MDTMNFPDTPWLILKTEPNLTVLHLWESITDEEIDSLIKENHHSVVAAQEGWIALIGGYDDDKRELYQIPEVKAFCERLVKRGIISLLHVSTMLEQEEKPWLKNKLGAMEIWAMAKGLFTDFGQLELEKSKFKEFVADLRKCNACVDELCTQVKDGQNRTKL